MFWGLFLSLIVGLFFLIGIGILKYTHSESKWLLFSISLAFVVMLNLLFFDLLPEIIERNNLFLILPVIAGLILFILIDKFIPHHHDHKNKKHNLNHVGVITICALFLHNLIEGFTLYNVTINSLTHGLLMTISISLHNIPLGFQIGTHLKKNKISPLLIFILCISAVLGALCSIMFGTINANISNILLSLTFGMLLYILIFELFDEIKSSFKKKEVIYGIIVGVIIIIITNIL